MDNNSLNSCNSSTTRADNFQVIGQQELERYDLNLLEEKLVVKRSKHKVGEIVVRKEIETRMVHIPIRREKLIVEKAGTSPELLAEVDLGEGEVNGRKFSELGNTDNIYQTQSKFVDLETARELLAKIARNPTNSKTKIRLEIISDSSESQQIYQSICDQL